MSKTITIELTVVYSYQDEVGDKPKSQVVDRGWAAYVAGKAVQEMILKRIPNDRVCSVVWGIKDE